MNNVNMHIMRASGRLEPYVPTILQIESGYLPKVCEKLNISDPDIAICDDDYRAIPETGVGGWTNNSYLTFIYIDPNSEHLLERIDFELRSTLAHELSHVARWRKFGTPQTLLENMVSEGLADHFDMVLNGGSPRPWDIALSENELISNLALARNLWNEPHFDYDRWTYGTADLPRWTSYSLGFKIVGDFVKKSEEKDHRKLNLLPAETFV